MPYRIDIPGQISEIQLKAIEIVASLVPSGGCVVEVGSLLGRSSWAWSRSVPPDATVFCIDPWEGNEGAHQIRNVDNSSYGYKAFLSNVADCPNIVPIRAYSPEGVTWNNKVDLYYEDAVHTSPVIDRNLAFWVSHLTHNGIACGDDYRPRFPDVCRAVDKLSRSLNRELIVVDFFWCLLPNPSESSQVTEVAEALRSLGRSADALRQTIPTRIQISPLTPMPDFIAWEANEVFSMRITNEGGQLWPVTPSGLLHLSTIIESVDGTVLGKVVTVLGCESLNFDEAVSVDVLVPGALLIEGAVTLMFCFAGYESNADILSFRHKCRISRADDYFGCSVDLLSNFQPSYGLGWSTQESGFRWSLGYQSELQFPALDHVPDGLPFVNLALRPYVSTKWAQQRLSILINGIVVMAGAFTVPLELSIPVVHHRNIITITFVHPDAHQPAASNPTSTDTRTLGFALERATISWSKPVLSIQVVDR